MLKLIVAWLVVFGFSHSVNANQEALAIYTKARTAQEFFQLTSKEAPKGYRAYFQKISKRHRRKSLPTASLKDGALTFRQGGRQVEVLLPKPGHLNAKVNGQSYTFNLSWPIEYHVRSIENLIQNKKSAWLDPLPRAYADDQSWWLSNVVAGIMSLPQKIMSSGTKPPPTCATMYVQLANHLVTQLGQDLQLNRVSCAEKKAAMSLRDGRRNISLVSDVIGTGEYSLTAKRIRNQDESLDMEIGRSGGRFYFERPDGTKINLHPLTELISPNMLRINDSNLERNFDRIVGEMDDSVRPGSHSLRTYPEELISEIRSRKSEILRLARVLRQTDLIRMCERCPTFEPEETLRTAIAELDRAQQGDRPVQESSR